MFNRITFWLGIRLTGSFSGTCFYSSQSSVMEVLKSQVTCCTFTFVSVRYKNVSPCYCLHETHPDSSHCYLSLHSCLCLLQLTWTALSTSRHVCLTDATQAQEVVVSYLPLSHIAAQMVDIWVTMRVGGATYFAQPDALKVRRSVWIVYSGEQSTNRWTHTTHTELSVYTCTVQNNSHVIKWLLCCL